MEYYDYDPKFGQGDGGVEYIDRVQTQLQRLPKGTFINTVTVELVSYAGTETYTNTTKQPATFDIDNDWHNRPA